MPAVDLQTRRSRVKKLQALLRLVDTALDLLKVSPGSDFSGVPLTGAIAEGVIVQLDDVSGTESAAKEYEVAVITLRLQPGLAGPSVVVPIEIKDAIYDPAANPQVIHGMAFVRAPAPAVAP